MSWNLNRRQVIRGAAVLVGSAVFTPAIVGRAKADTFSIKISSPLPNDPKYGNGRVYFDNLVKALEENGLKDVVEVNFFPDGQLGTEMDVINSIKLGVIDAMVAAPSTPANLIPSLGVYDLGYLFQSYEQQTEVLDAGGAKFAEDQLDKLGVTVLGWQYNFGSRSVDAKFPVKGPQDLAGKHIRTLPSKIVTECLTLMGAAATPMAFGEIYTGLQAGVLDGLEQDPPTILSGKFYESAKYYSLTKHIFDPLCTFISNVTLSRFDDETREKFLDAGKKAALATRKHGLAVEADALAELKNRGVEIVETDIDAFRERVKPQIARFLSENPSAKPVVDLALAAHK